MSQSGNSALIINKSGILKNIPDSNNLLLIALNQIPLSFYSFDK